jgi:hypothetical protein
VSSSPVESQCVSGPLANQTAATRAYFSPDNVKRRLMVFADQVERGGLNSEDRAALLPYVKREMGR